MDPIVSRVAIAERAYADAQRLNAGATVNNPYPLDSEAARLWDVTVRRHLAEELVEEGA